MQILKADLPNVVVVLSTCFSGLVSAGRMFGSQDLRGGGQKAGRSQAVTKLAHSRGGWARLPDAEIGSMDSGVRRFEGFPFWLSANPPNGAPGLQPSF